MSEHGAQTTERIYVAGPMTGLPEFNYPAFRAAAQALGELGYWVEDPSTNVNPTPGDYHGWLRAGLQQLIRCDAVALLPGWEASGGARLEVNVAATLGLRVAPLSEWLASSASTTRQASEPRLDSEVVSVPAGNRDDEEPESIPTAAVMLLHPPVGWFMFGAHVDRAVPLIFWGTGEDGLPLWERPATPSVALAEQACGASELTRHELLELVARMGAELAAPRTWEYGWVGRSRIDGHESCSGAASSADEAVHIALVAQQADDTTSRRCTYHAQARLISEPGPWVELDMTEPPQLAHSWPMEAEVEVESVE